MEQSPPSEADSRSAQPPFMKPEISLPCSQDPVTGHCTEPAESSPQLQVRLKIHFNIILPSKRSNPIGLFLSDVMTKTLYVS
jgi:hypothetical protein